MAERGDYEAVLSSQAVAYLVALPKARQRKLIGLIFQLAAPPAQIGDYSEPDDTGRPIQFIRIGDLVIAYWPDDAVKELRIVEIQEV